jgi:hypothetical protein
METVRRVRGQLFLATKRLKGLVKCTFAGERGFGGLWLVYFRVEVGLKVRRVESKLLEIGLFEFKGHCPGAHVATWLRANNELRLLAKHSWHIM